MFIILFKSYHLSLINARGAEHRFEKGEAHPARCAHMITCVPNSQSDETFPSDAMTSSPASTPGPNRGVLPRMGSGGGKGTPLIAFDNLFLQYNQTKHTNSARGVKREAARVEKSGIVTSAERVSQHRCADPDGTARLG